VVADCLVRDLSETGAKLELSENVVIPDVIDLYIPKKDETLRASVLWRYGDLIGVAFNKNASPQQERAAGAAILTVVGRTPQDGGLAGRLQRIEAELASLKRAIENLSEPNSPVRLPI
jgi:hypothetical protein